MFASHEEKQAALGEWDNYPAAMRQLEEAVASAMAPEEHRAAVKREVRCRLLAGESLSDIEMELDARENRTRRQEPA